MSGHRRLNLFPKEAFGTRKFRNELSVLDLVSERRNHDDNSSDHYIDFSVPWVAVHTENVLDVITALNAWPSVSLEDWSQKPPEPTPRPSGPFALPPEKRKILPPIEGTIFIFHCGFFDKLKHRSAPMKTLSKLGGRAFWFCSHRYYAYEVWEDGELIRMVSDEIETPIEEFGERLPGEPALQIRESSFEEHRRPYVDFVHVHDFAAAMKADPYRIPPIPNGEIGYFWSWQE